MKFILPLVIILASVGATFVIAEEKADKAPTTKPVAANVNCAVMTEHKADPTVTVEHKGKHYALCCDGCIEDFKKEPDKFAATAK